MSNSSI